MNKTAAAMLDEPSSLPSPRSEPDFNSSTHQTIFNMDQSVASRLDNVLLEEERRFKYGAAPENEHGKLICSHAECASFTFDRRCEWSKHMDRHERPYRCEEPGCEKLRGFTYSGGLLRHQREVHKQHGGPKEMLMCPFPFCKRNSGTGFTRRENLNEHIKRVHRQPMLIPSGDQESITAQGTDPHQQINVAQSPYETQPLHMGDVQPSSGKSRKRRANTTTRDSEAGNIAELALLREEIEKLRRDNDEKDARISRLADTVQMLGVAQQQLAQAAQQAHMVAK